MRLNLILLVFFIVPGVSLAAGKTVKYLPKAYREVPYSVQLVEADFPPLTWTLIDGELPPHFLLTDDGRLLGSPTVANDNPYIFSLRAADAAPQRNFLDTTFVLFILEPEVSLASNRPPIRLVADDGDSEVLESLAATPRQARDSRSEDQDHLTAVLSDGKEPILKPGPPQIFCGESVRSGLPCLEKLSFELFNINTRTDFLREAVREGAVRKAFDTFNVGVIGEIRFPIETDMWFGNTRFIPEFERVRVTKVTLRKPEDPTVSLTRNRYVIDSDWLYRRFFGLDVGKFTAGMFLGVHFEHQFANPSTTLKPEDFPMLGLTQPVKLKLPRVMTLDGEVGVKFQNRDVPSRFAKFGLTFGWNFDSVLARFPALDFQRRRRGQRGLVWEFGYDRLLSEDPKIAWETQLDGRFYFTRLGDSTADTRLRMKLTHSVRIPLFSKLYIEPGVEVFVFQNKFGDLGLFFPDQVAHGTFWSVREFIRLSLAE